MSFTSDDGTWFEVVPGKPEKGRVKFRLLSLGDNEVIEEATEKKIKEYKTKENGDLQLFEFVEIDEKLAAEMRIDLIILDWENIELDGKPLKCTKANKLLLSRKNSSFLLFQSRSMRKLSEDGLAKFGANNEMGN